MLVVSGPARHGWTSDLTQSADDERSFTRMGDYFRAWTTPHAVQIRD
jgi:hypothetical protein